MYQKESEWEHDLNNLERKTARGMWWVRIDRVRDIISEAISAREKEIAETLNSRYGKDGLPSLVIIESHEGGTTQRPALEDILSIILKKTL